MFNTRAAASLLVLLALAAVASAEYYVPLPVDKPEPTTTYASPPPPPYVPKPTTTYSPAPYVPTIKITIAVEGVVMCKSGYSSYPIEGAKVKLVCPVVNSYGRLEAKVVLSSYPTDAKGYFFFIPYGLSVKVKNLEGCRVKLESSPLGTCKIPTNVNKGISGAPLSSNYKFLPDKHLNLYTVGPFFFSAPHTSHKPGY